MAPRQIAVIIAAAVFVLFLLAKLRPRMRRGRVRRRRGPQRIPTRRERRVMRLLERMTLEERERVREHLEQLAPIEG